MTAYYCISVICKWGIFFFYLYMLLNITENIIAQVGIREKKKKGGGGRRRKKRKKTHQKKYKKRERESFGRFCLKQSS